LQHAAAGTLTRWQRKIPYLRSIISVVILAAAASFAAESAIRISCRRTSQADFDKAVALINRKPVDARRMFLQMWRRDNDCAILFWGVAMSAPSADARWDASLEAIVTAVVVGVNASEWQKIATLTVGSSSN
jgi:hypothetical protein